MVSFVNEIMGSVKWKRIWPEMRNPLSLTEASYLGQCSMVDMILPFSHQLCC